MATYTKDFSSGWGTLKLTVTTESQSVANNTSYLKAVLSYVSKVTFYITSQQKTCEYTVLL